MAHELSTKQKIAYLRKQKKKHPKYAKTLNEIIKGYKKKPKRSKK